MTMRGRAIRIVITPSVGGVGKMTPLNALKAGIRDFSRNDGVDDIDDDDDIDNDDDNLYFISFIP